MQGSILIRFIRNSDKHDDDKITIRKSTTCDDFDLSIKYAGVGYNNSESVTFYQNISQDNLKKYISSLLVLIMHDEIPYFRIQVDMPNAPSVMLSTNSYSCESVCDAINTLVEVTLASWPTDTRS